MTAAATTRPTEAPQREPIDPAAVPCPCCGEIPWCREELAAVAGAAEAAPELLIGTATYGYRRWSR